ncbi:MAG TPA: metallophosphoesterase [Chitinophagaceae bacterium]
MRRLLRYLLLKPVLWAAEKFSSRPDKLRIFKALEELFASIIKEPGKKGLVIPFELNTGKFIILSDQHKGARNGADDFTMAEPNYLAALEYYFQKGFCYINLGDSEELWENNLTAVRKYNEKNFRAEKKFIPLNRFVKIFGNHDLFWDNDPLASWQLKNIYGEKIKVYEGVVLSTSFDSKALHIYCTHGHQGDAQSDGNWFTKFFVAKIWAPFQAYLRINPNTPAYDSTKKSLHNTIMYEWSSAQKDILLITGHTHQPVFGSLTQLERLYKKFQLAQQMNETDSIVALQTEIRKKEREFTAVAIDYMSMKPSYFNSGCCCFTDGDITGIEIDEGCLRLIKWELQDEKPVRIVLEETALENLVKEL